MEENENRLSREILVLGQENVNKIKNASVAVFGLGGVGSYCAEALARAGIENITIVDGDRINVTNINRQLYALSSTVGKMKTDVAEERIKDINPDVKLEKCSFYYGKDNEDLIDFTGFDCVADAIDSVSSKLLIAEKCRAAECYEISCMGTGNKLQPELFEVADIYKTSVCPLARVIRYELKKRNIEHLDVVYSKEIPVKSGENIGSTSFVPPVAGMLMASRIIKKIIM